MSMHKILQQSLEMKKVCSKLVLKVLMVEQIRIWSVYKASVNAVEEQWRTTAKKSSHGSILVEIDVNLIFQRPRCGDGRMGAVSENCRRCILYRNTPEIKNL